MNASVWHLYRRINVQMVTFVQKNLSQSTQIARKAMFKKLRELYKEYKPYVRVDLIMYGVLILSIILYFIFSIIFD
jgi:uncharacterized protein YsxB (DUF464 family)